MIGPSRGSSNPEAIGPAATVSPIAIRISRHADSVHAESYSARPARGFWINGTSKLRSLSAWSPAKIVIAKATKPKSAGISKRARIIVLSKPMAWITNCAPIIQPLPTANSRVMFGEVESDGAFSAGFSEESIDAGHLMAVFSTSISPERPSECVPDYRKPDLRRGVDTNGGSRGRFRIRVKSGHKAAEGTARTHLEISPTIPRLALPAIFF